MRLWSSLASFLLLSTTLAAAPGCPGEEQCRDYTPPASFDPNVPVSLKNDVKPIFANSCAFSTCHGSTAGDPNGVFLGGENASTIRAGLVDVASGQLPSMPFVKPGDPRSSYLMRKMDGSHCVLDAQCKDGTCGDSMPRGEEPLDVAARDTVRRWIAQGAKDD
ncbi:MAG: hypothetical protein KIT84_03475 [Labilithrix sp.]|nr:hypothetical protein [Labilithrix sp.]MCW5810044.1 hypothetical protein [Labilithrix sp.]